MVAQLASLASCCWLRVVVFLATDGCASGYVCWGPVMTRCSCVGATPTSPPIRATPMVAQLAIPGLTAVGYVWLCFWLLMAVLLATSAGDQWWQDAAASELPRRAHPSELPRWWRSLQSLAWLLLATCGCVSGYLWLCFWLRLRGTS